jgi:hypothetical protein
MEIKVPPFVAAVRPRGPEKKKGKAGKGAS